MFVIAESIVLFFIIIFPQIKVCKIIITFILGPFFLFYYCRAILLHNYKTGYTGNHLKNAGSDREGRDETRGERERERG